MTSKITNKEALLAAITAIQGDRENVEYYTVMTKNGEGKQVNPDELISKLEGMIATLDKKNSGDKKLTATQEANVQYRELIMEYLATQDTPKSCGEIGDSIPELSSFRSQKVAALLKPLVDGGRVKKTTGKKGQSLFAIA